MQKEFHFKKVLLPCFHLFIERFDHETPTKLKNFKSLFKKKILVTHTNYTNCIHRHSCYWGPLNRERNAQQNQQTNKHSPCRPPLLLLYVSIYSTVGSLLHLSAYHLHYFFSLFTAIFYFTIFNPIIPSHYR